MSNAVYILGGYQTDFSRNWAREGLEIFDMLSHTVDSGLESCSLDAKEIEAAHIGNFVAELFCNQCQLGGLFSACRPEFHGLPTARHEGACASGSLAALAASADIEAGRYGLIAVLGIEMMRNVDGVQAANYIGAPAMWAGHECTDVKFPWPHQFSELAEEYNRRYGIKQEHLARIGEINFANAKRNPNSQTRNWSFNEKSFTEDDEANPVIEGRTRKQDCGQITDGAGIVFLASEDKAREYAVRNKLSLDDIPRIKGWGHKTGPITYQAKINASRDNSYVFPHLREAIQDAFKRADIDNVDSLDGIELHDCFTATEYMAIDHFGITKPGESWRAIESGEIEMGGRIPVNASGGLIGLGHPVGATGVRMLLDSYKQTSNKADDYQIDGARNIATLNVGGSATTVVSFVVGVH